MLMIRSVCRNGICRIGVLGAWQWQKSIPGPGYLPDIQHDFDFEFVGLIGLIGSHQGKCAGCSEGML